MNAFYRLVVYSSAFSGLHAFSLIDGGKNCFHFLVENRDGLNVYLLLEN